MIRRFSTLLALAALAMFSAGKLAAQSWTGEFRLIGLGAHTPAVARAPGNTEPLGPPESDVMAGGTADISFRAGRLRLGPEGSVLRGSKRRVWSLGGVGRYELSGGDLRPYVLLGAGFYFWDRQIDVTFAPGSTDGYSSWGSDVTPLSLSAGGGLVFGPERNRVSGMLELRWHRSLTEGEFTPGPRSLLSVGLGARVAW